MRQKIIVTKICRNCNCPFDIPRWKHHQQFCSTKCKKEAQVVKLNYNNNLNIKEWLPTEISRQRRISIINYFNHKCIYCNRPLKNKYSNRIYLVRIPFEFTNGSEIIIPICEEDYFNMKPNKYESYYFLYEEFQKWLDKNNNNKNNNK